MLEKEMLFVPLLFLASLYFLVGLPTLYLEFRYGMTEESEEESSLKHDMISFGTALSCGVSASFVLLLVTYMVV